MKILIFGGTRFLGPCIVEEFQKQGHKVVIASRGNSFVPKGVDFVKVDRYDEASLRANLGSCAEFDLVIDCLCYSAQHARTLLSVIRKSCKRLIMISTRSVYQGEGPFSETDFLPHGYPYSLDAVPAPPGRKPEVDEISYGEGKRQGESYYVQQLGRRACIVRYPIVVGEGDYTERTSWHSLVASDGGKVYFGSDLSQKVSFISLSEAASSLVLLAESGQSGVFNAASQPISLKSLARVLLPGPVSKFLTEVAEQASVSPYCSEGNRVLDCSRIEELGFQPHRPETYFSRLVTA